MTKTQKIIIAFLIVAGSSIAWRVAHSPTTPSAPALSEAESAKMDLIRLDSPHAGDTIESPLVIKGIARGNWFFEGSFPVILTDWDGLIIAQHYATAEEPWMTTDFVPFTATITFDTPVYKNNGALILKKDNPSDNPKFDDALEIPIFYGNAMNQ